MAAVTGNFNFLNLAGKEALQKKKARLRNGKVILERLYWELLLSSL